MICSEFERQSAEMICDPGIKILAYPLYMYIEDYAHEGMVREPGHDSLRSFRMIGELLPSIQKGMKVGIQKNWMPFEAYFYLCELFGQEGLADTAALLRDARVIKTPWEIEVLRYNAKCTEKAMEMTARRLYPGMTHAEVHTQFRKCCLEAAPELTIVSHSHTMGRVFSPPWMPLETRLNWGDIIRFDGGPYTNGYKSDLGRTYAVGRASSEKEALFEKLWKGYEFAIEHIGPGVKMADIFNGTMKAIGIPNLVRGHFGHSIGCDISGEEAPQISDRTAGVFEPGMVMCVEPPSYYGSKSQTYNIEDTLLITENGVELFTHANPSMYIF